MLLFSGGEDKSDTKAPVYEAYSDEARLERILTRINGAGDVSVMITYYGTKSYDVAFEEKQTNAERGDEISSSSESSVIKNKDEALIRGELYPKVKGAVIIAEGAGNIEVKKALCDAAVAVLDVASYRVCVLEGKEMRK